MSQLKSYASYMCNIRKARLVVLILLGMSINFAAFALWPSTLATDQTRITTPDAERFIKSAVQIRTDKAGCSGIAIGPTAILTARHCLIGEDGLRLDSGSIGLQYIVTTDDGSLTQKRHTSPKYDILFMRYAESNDIAVINIQDENFTGFATYINLDEQIGGVNIETLLIAMLRYFGPTM